MNIQYLSTDFLILGGGAAGCWAALEFCKRSQGKALLLEKANIRRSGCLAAGVNALNAYIGPGHTPQDYADYAKNDAEGAVDEALLLSMAERLNGTVQKLESLGLTILKNPDGSYATRGWRNVKINGENIKPLLAGAVAQEPRITVLNQANAFDYIVQGDRVTGAFAIAVQSPVLYVVTAKAVLCATGGAAGLYQPNHPGFSRHKLWYPPFNTGAGYAMGVRAGAKMTGFAQRFVALRCKDTIAPTGTLAQGVGAKQINALGEVYEQKYGTATMQRVRGTVRENAENRGPCYLRTAGIPQEQDDELAKAYLNMAPGQTLRWLETAPPSVQNVEIDGTEPYITGGHTASGYAVAVDRATSLKGLFAAGDAAGGCPQKYVTGALAEAEIAAHAALQYMQDDPPQAPDATPVLQTLNAYFFYDTDTVDALEEEMQGVMDAYAGGISRQYTYTKEGLAVAESKIAAIAQKSKSCAAKDMQDLVYILELQERLVVCQAVIAALKEVCA
ncbi:MAG: adenylyl-sulfate reductase subunit alpha [Oscillospiraceae bacterium]|nr:adenylyl-sulfate reductase subunit alpha [Oscillospiraceae bacterium]